METEAPPGEANNQLENAASQEASDVPGDGCGEGSPSDGDGGKANEEGSEQGGERRDGGDGGGGGGAASQAARLGGVSRPCSTALR